MNGLIAKVKHYLKRVVADHYQFKYKDEDFNGRLLYLQELLELIDVKQLLVSVRNVGNEEVLSTKFNDIKGASRVIVNVSQSLRDNRSIEPYLIKTDPVNRNLMSFLLTSEGKYIDPTVYIQAVLEYSSKVAQYVNTTEDKNDSVYLHNSYLLQFYVEDLIILIREFLRISIR